MDRFEVMALVINAVEQVQVLSGKRAEKIDSNTRPIGDIAGFDSFSGVEAMVILCESLGRDLPEDCNPFLQQDSHLPPSIGEITDFLCEILGVGTKSNE